MKVFNNVVKKNDNKLFVININKATTFANMTPDNIIEGNSKSFRAVDICNIFGALNIQDIPTENIYCAFYGVNSELGKMLQCQNITFISTSDGFRCEFEGFSITSTFGGDDSVTVAKL